MSPEQRATATEITLLRKEIATQRSSMPQWAAHAAEALSRWSQGPDAFVLAFAAVAAHHWYAALELVFERVARRIDLRTPVGDSWHRELFAQSLLDVPGLRPPVAPPELAGDLDELRKFRHFFVHGSVVVGLEAARVRPHLERIVRIHPLVWSHLDDLDRFLAAAVLAVTT